MQPKVVFLMLFLFSIASPAGAQTTGVMNYDPVSGRYKVYDGTGWITMGNALYLPLGNCSKEGQIDFDGLLSNLKYCGKGKWRSFSVALTLNVCTAGGRWHFNSSSGKYEFCNGLVWVTMNPGSISLAGL